ncbi:hypothetical protein RHOFW510R12_01235 [Rhodanobacter sp. FW510-R12]|uniref:competence protein CoiA n=1 Tax=Rhodanobacter thiooxydans TaxID=416169 RepID=UPI00091F3D2F|nr:competence protein CoiA family protein [Rhodanobacter thiooxydans]UJJ56637.1 hypothetical protein LRK53_18690 [Rhodanobacter thiooxydans]
MNHPHGWDIAYRAGTDDVLDGSALDPVAWRALQVTYRVGELEMPCCRAPAVPKTSPNGFPFFAHLAGACQTSPESQWHLAGKQAVRDAARALGYQVALERASAPGAPRWRADLWVESGGGPFVVELQRSYQHLRDYVERQRRYADAGLPCLWLLMKPRYLTLSKAMAKHRMREEFAGQKRWPEDQAVWIAGLPVACLELQGTPMVVGPQLRTSLPDVLSAFACGDFRWSNGRWCVGSGT